MTNMTYIYALRDPRNGAAFYIGKSNNPLKRMKGHLFHKVEQLTKGRLRFQAARGHAGSLARGGR